MFRDELTEEVVLARELVLIGHGMSRHGNFELDSADDRIGIDLF